MRLLRKYLSFLPFATVCLMYASSYAGIRKQTSPHKPKILVYGSVNIDHVFRVSTLVKPGETIPSKSYELFLGGKGCNQSIALARAGADVYLAGKIGKDHSQMILRQLHADRVKTDFLKIDDSHSTGLAMIQVNDLGENSIVITGGANQNLTSAEIKETLQFFHKGDYLVLQNEVNGLELMIREAHKKGIHIVFNPAPMSKKISKLPLKFINTLIINEEEGKALTGESKNQLIVDTVIQELGVTKVILTLGAKGSLYKDHFKQFFTLAKKVDAIDTTGAGDAFTGFFVANLAKNFKVEDCVSKATIASAMTVTKKGPTAIPFAQEL